MDRNGSVTIGKQKTQQEESEDDTPLLCTDGLQTNDTKNLNGIMDGQKNNCRYLDYLATAAKSYIATLPGR